MKIWKSLIVIFLIPLLGWGIYMLYQKFVLARKINSLELISGDAVFTFETYQADKTWNQLVNQPLWKLLSQFPAFQDLSKQLTTLDSLLGANGSVSKILRNKQVTVSYHTTGADNFNLLFTVNFGTATPERLLQDLKSKIPANARFQSRKYSDQEIIEYLDGSNTRKWTATVLNNVLLLSSSSFVIEEAIRFFLRDDSNQLSDKLGDQLNSDSNLGRLILTSKGIGKLLGGVSTSKESASIQHFNLSDHVVSMELSFEENKLFFKGPIRLDSDINFLPSVQASFEEVKKLISSRTQSITQINLDGIYETQKLTNRAFSPLSTLSGEIQSKLLERGFLDYLTGEMYLLDLEPQGNELNNKALLIKTTQPELIRSFFKEFRGDADFQSVDFYGDNEILFFPEEEFPAHLFGGKFKGFEQTHMSFVKNILIMTNSALTMKWMIDDYSQGNNWNENPVISNLNVISPSDGYSKTFILPKILPSWIQSSNAAWSTFLQKFEPELLAFPIVSFKVHQLPTGQEGSLVIHYLEDTSLIKPIKKSFELVSGKQIHLPNRVIYGPKVIRNFNDNTEDLIVQDDKNILYLINSAGEQVFSQQLSSPVISEIFQIDFYKNGKLQVLIATSDQIFAIDRLGNLLPGFPVSVAGEKITGLNLVDYDQKKEYRYFVSTDKENLWLFDREGKSLEGWSPLALGEQSIGAPFHVRVPGKGDFMVVQGKTGKVHFFNRRGEKQPGSPLNLGKDFETPISTLIGKNTSLLAVSKNGELLVGTFSGEILSKKQLLKVNRDDQFELVSDRKSGSYLFLLRQFNKTLVLNEREEELMTLPVWGENAKINYFDFGNTRKILAATDPIQGFGYLYDLQGHLLTNAPLESEGEIEISHNPGMGQLIIRTRSGERILEYIIPD